MDTKKISMVSAGALLALTSTAWAGPMPMAVEQAISPPRQAEQVHYYHRRYGRQRNRDRGWHLGWYRHGYRYPYYPRYTYRYPGYYDGWEPAGAAVAGAVGLAPPPFAWTAGGWLYYTYP